MPKQVVGLGIDDNSVKIVEAKQHWTGISVLKLNEQIFDHNNTFDPIYKSLAASLKENCIDTKETVIALAGNDVSYHSVGIPLLPENEVENEIKYKLEPLLPFTISDAVICYYKTSHGMDNKQEYFVCAAQKSRITDIISQVEKAGLKVKDVIPASEAFKALIPGNRPEFTLLYKTGFDSLKIEYKENIAVSAKKGEEDISPDIFVTGNGYDKSASKHSMLRSSVGTLDDEVFRSMALGIAACYPRKNALSLVPKEIKSRAKRFIKKNSNYKLAYAVAFALMALTLLGFYRTDTGMKSELRNMIDSKNKLEGKMLQSNMGFLKAGSAPAKEDVFFGIIKELERITPEYIFFQSMDYRKNGNVFMIKGIFMDNKDNAGVSGFISSLRQENIFEAVELSYLKKSGRYEFPVSEFELKCGLHEGAGK